MIRQAFLCSLLFAVVHSLHPKAICLMRAFLYEVDFTQNVLQTYQEFINRKDFSVKKDVYQMEEWEMVDLDQFTTHFELEQILVNYRQFSEQIQKKIDNCKLSIAKLEKICNDVFPDDGCEIIDGIAVAKKCPPGYFSLDFVYCVPICPSSYSDDPLDPFVCKKSYEAARSKEIKESFKTSPIAFRNLDYFYECPPNYKSLLLDICIRECPVGWVDLGKDCEKPSLIRRDNELFIYKFELDDE